MGPSLPPPYSQVPIWHDEFLAHGTCPAVSGSSRCQKPRTCDTRVGSKARQQVVDLVGDLVYGYEDYRQEDRFLVADVVARLSICVGCEKAGKRVQVKATMLQQLDLEWALKRRGLPHSLPEEACEEDRQSEASSSPFSVEARSRRHSSSPVVEPSTITEDSSPPAIPPSFDHDVSSTGSSPFSLTLSSRNSSSPAGMEPSMITNNSSPPPPGSPPPPVPTMEYHGLFFKTPPTNVRVRNQQHVAPARPHPTPPSTPPNQTSPGLEPTPPTKLRITAPSSARPQTPPPETSIAQVPSPGTPTRIPKAVVQRETRSFSLPAQQDDASRHGLTNRDLRLENSLLHGQLDDAQDEIITLKLQLRAARVEGDKWRKLYWSLKDCVKWLFDRAEQSEDEGVVEEEVEELVVDGGETAYGSESPISLGQDVDWPLLVPRKRQPESFDVVGEAEAVQEKVQLPPPRRRRRMTRGMQSLGSLNSIMEEDEESSPRARAAT